MVNKLKVILKNPLELKAAEFAKIDQAVMGLSEILNSDEFRNEVLFHSKFTETNGLTNQQIYEKILSGDQIIDRDQLGALDFNLVLYRKSWSKVVGYTFTNSMTIWMNRKYFSTPKSIASNLGHELMHQLDFTHNKSWATSVPYTMNRIIERLWK